ncbi:MAG: hypothetical protein HC909_04160 [Blastochloris sp.]|nr:hypothetical protein [Blastochloris sp.]
MASWIRDRLRTLARSGQFGRRVNARPVVVPPDSERLVIGANAAERDAAVVERILDKPSQPSQTKSG